MTKTSHKNTASLLRLYCLFLFYGTAFMTQSTEAEDRALLIGVGNYQNPSVNDLQGIDLDIAMMKESAALMGFKDSNIKILMDGEATLGKVTSVFNDWLVKGVYPTDRVFIFFSGHGANVPDENGDEADGADEVLVMHDAAVEKRGGKPTLAGVLVDDEFGKMLSQIPSSETLVLIDACHSGTVTKSWLGGGRLGWGETQTKFFEYPGMPQTTKGSFAIRSKTPKSNFVGVAAAGDGEKAIATKKGSLFTVSVSESLKKAALGSKPLSPSQIQKASAEWIRQYKQETNANFALFQPVLTGNQTLAQKPLRLRKVGNKTRGEKWQKLEAIADNAEILNISANQGNYHVGDNLVIKIDVDKAGYLNIVNIGSDDDITVLFPNGGHTNNQVQAGKVSIPTDEMKSKNYILKTGEPFGDNIIVAFLSSHPVNVYQSGTGKGFRGLTDLGLTEMKDIATRGSFSAVSENSQDWFKAGKIITRVCQSASDC